MPRPFSDHEKDLIRSRLLQQGYKLFAAFGLKKTSVEELAAAAGISKGAFYLFYSSKEDLFMDVVEDAEQRFRLEILALVDRPGPSPRLRLYAVFKKAFTLWKTVPVLKIFTRRDYDQLYRLVDPDKIQQHLASDRAFIHELVARCQAAGIPVTAHPDQIAGLMYAILFASLHEDDFGPDRFAATLDLLLELVAAFCLGEITLQIPIPTPEGRYEPLH
jgi:AcrR family transcriptional regulator